MNNKQFATAINCIDGRAQMPVIKWFKTRFGINYVDMITEPGPERLLSDNEDRLTIESVRKRLNMSVSRHDSIFVAVVAHNDCAGNPVKSEIQAAQIAKAVNTVMSWGISVEVFGLLLDEKWAARIVR